METNNTHTMDAQGAGNQDTSLNTASDFLQSIKLPFSGDTLEMVRDFGYLGHKGTDSDELRYVMDVITKAISEYNIERIYEVDVYAQWGDEFDGENINVSIIGIDGDFEPVLLGCLGLDESGDVVDYDAHYSALDSLQGKIKESGSDYVYGYGDWPFDVVDTDLLLSSVVSS